MAEMDNPTSIKSNIDIVPDSTVAVLGLITFKVTLILNLIQNLSVFTMVVASPFKVNSG